LNIVFAYCEYVLCFEFVYFGVIVEVFGVEFCVVLCT